MGEDQGLPVGGMGKKKKKGAEEFMENGEEGEEWGES